MKKVRIKQICLENWKSLNLDVTFNEKGTTTISGRCGIGKSSIMHSWYWLWTGYANPYTKKNAELYDNKVEITKDTPTAIVKAIFTIDGIEYSLKRTAKPSFVRDKGSDEYIKKPTDKYVIYLDDIEISPTHFNEWVDGNLCPVDLLPYCLDGSFFSTLCENDKDKARNILMSMVGEISENDFVENDYSSVYDKDKDYTPIEFRVKTKNQIKDFDTKREKLSTLISEKKKTINESRYDVFPNIDEEIKEKNNRIKEIDGIILGGINNNSEKAIKLANKRLLFESNREIYFEGKKAERAKINGKIEGIQKYNANVVLENTEKRRKRNAIKELIEIKNKKLQDIDAELQKLNNKAIEVKSLVFVDDKCSYCGQDLPYDMLEESKKRFNNNKIEQLEEIKKLSEDSITLKKIVEDELSKLNTELSSIPNDDELRKFDDVQNELCEFDANNIPYEQTEEGISLQKEIAKLKEEVDEEQDFHNLSKEKQNIMIDLEELNRKLGVRDIAIKLNDEVKILEDEFKQSAIERVKLMGVLALCDKWISERNKIISQRINNNLLNAKIEMFESLKNGDKIDSCVITDENGVKLSTINHSKRIKINIELQKLFCEKNNIQMPIFIDECSIFDSVSLPREANTQMIYIFASDSNTLSVN